MPAAGQRRLRGGEDGRRRRKVGLADFHVDHGSAGRLERSRRGLHFHDVERLDSGDARRGDNSGIHRRDELAPLQKEVW